MLNRRQFVASTLAVGAAVAVGSGCTIAGDSKPVQIWEVTIRCQVGTKFLRLRAPDEWPTLSHLFGEGNVLNVRLVETNHAIKV